MKIFLKNSIFIVSYLIFINIVNINSKEIFYDDGTSDSGYSPWGSSNNVAVAVLFTLPYTPIKIKNVKVFITDQGKFNMPFRIKILDISDELTPGKNLLKNEIIVNATTGNEWVTVDLSKYNIIIKQKSVFVAMEWTTPPGEKGKDAQFIGFSIGGLSIRSWTNPSGTPNGWICRFFINGKVRKGSYLIRLTY